MKVSQRKTQANRRNALKSTGPKTAEGKSRSRWNALRHGLPAKAVIIEKGEGQERREDFEVLLEALQKDLAPEGALEQILVEKIAVDYWRLRRLLASETGRIRGQLDNFQEDEVLRIGKELSSSLPFEERRHLELMFRRLEVLPDALQLVDKARAGQAEPSEALEEAVRITSSDGYGEQGKDGLLSARSGGSNAGEDGWTLQSLRSAIVEQLAKAEEESAAVNERLELLLDGKRLALQMPPGSELELYMRYETMLERQLQRDLELLANVQRMRILGPVGYRPVRAVGEGQSEAAGKEGVREGS